MERVAIFVDAGYLFAQGSACICGTKQPRVTLTLNEAAAVAELTSLAQQKAPNASLLRIYWYDGAGPRGPTIEQHRLAQLDNIKIRLGFINSQGQQKGVDPLIVTDLVELARNQAMSDAVLLAGDEDVRIGVHIAQSFGVRVHLLGIAPSRGSQSPQLMQESDTTAEWDKTIIEKMIRYTARPPVAALGIPTQLQGQLSVISHTTEMATTAHKIDIVLERVVDAFVASLKPSDIAGIKAFWAAGQRGVPPEFDGRLIATGGGAMKRLLDREEMRAMRARFTASVRKRL